MPTILYPIAHVYVTVLLKVVVVYALERTVKFAAGSVGTLQSTTVENHSLFRYCIHMPVTTFAIWNWVTPVSTG